MRGLHDVLSCRRGNPTYHLKVATGSFAARVELTLELVPPAQASFAYFPSDPSTFDTVQFDDNSWDIAGIVERTWNLGDGTTPTGCCPLRRYASDGSYLVQLNIRTTDGRTATATATVEVQTHDVAITQMLVPKTGRVGHSKQISVTISNSRYPGGGGGVSHAQRARRLIRNGRPSREGGPSTRGAALDLV